MFLDLAPSAILILIIWVKLSYFNFPPLEKLENDWNPWYLTQAVQAVLGTLATLLVLFAPLALLPAARRVAVLLGFNLLASLLVLSDAVHFRFFGDIISIAEVAGGWQIGLIYKSVLQLLELRDVALVADLPLAALLWPRYRRALHRAPTFAPHLPRAAARWMLLAGLVLAIAVPVRIVALDRGDTFRFTFFRFFGARKIGLLNYHLYEGGMRLSRAVFVGRQVDPEDRERAMRYLDQWRAKALAPSPQFGLAQGKNVIFLMVESLHAFPIGLRIDGQEVTPNLNALADRSLYFTHFFDQTWEGTTSDGEFTSLQSLHPLPVGSVGTRYPSNRFRGLPEVLAERGYHTLSAHAYFGSLWNMRGMHPNLGFQRSLFREAYQMGEQFNMGLADAEFFRQTVPHLEQLPRPFMAYLMTLSTHHPYELPDRYKVLNLGEFQGTLLGDYLQTVRYFDTALGEFIQALEADGLLQESILVLYGDHKADLGNPADLTRLLERHAGVAPSTISPDPRAWLEQRRLPLLIHVPDDEGSGTYVQTGGHLDIAPTVLNLLGVSNHGMATLGSDLLRGQSSQVVFRDGSFVEGDTLCIVLVEAESGVRCFNWRAGVEMPAADFADRLRAARDRLEISDMVVRGNLLPGRPNPRPQVAGSRFSG